MKVNKVVHWLIRSLKEANKNNQLTQEDAIQLVRLVSEILLKPGKEDDGQPEQ